MLEFQTHLSRPLVGSSRYIKRGRVKTSTAMLSRRLSPPLSPFKCQLPTFVSAHVLSPISKIVCSTILFMSAFDKELGSWSCAAYWIVSRTVNVPVRMSSWVTYACTQCPQCQFTGLNRIQLHNIHKTAVVLFHKLVAQIKAWEFTAVPYDICCFRPFRRISPVCVALRAQRPGSWMRSEGADYDTRHVICSPWLLQDVYSDEFFLLEKSHVYAVGTLHYLNCLNDFFKQYSPILIMWLLYAKRRRFLDQLRTSRKESKGECHQKGKPYLRERQGALFSLNQKDP